MKKPLAAAARAALAMSLLFAGAQPAWAYSSETPYCAAHLYANTHLQSPPNTALYCQMPSFGSTWDGYTGPVNGKMGRNSWKAVQRYLQDRWKYKGPINGIPGPYTYRAMQRAGNAWGWYPTPNAEDRTMGSRDWVAWAYHVRTSFFGI